MTEFWLIRHGQTDWNARRIYQGQADIPLNAVGFEQARLLADSIKCEQFDAIFASDLIRAVQTAEILAGDSKNIIQLDRRLREICQGAWEGLSLDEVQEKYADDFKRGFEDPAYSRAPGGESVAEVAERMATAASEIARQYPDGKVMLVSHGLAVSTLFCQANDIPLTQVYHYIPDNAVPLQIRW